MIAAPPESNPPPGAIGMTSRRPFRLGAWQALAGWRKEPGEHPSQILQSPGDPANLRRRLAPIESPP
ncbi:MAG: hypothetical protein CMP81_04765 [Fulvimarina sp.]|nr:hypothetical protein [Fulvimarina sp.]